MLTDIKKFHICAPTKKCLNKQADIKVVSHYENNYYENKISSHKLPNIVSWNLSKRKISLHDQNFDLKSISESIYDF